MQRNAEGMHRNAGGMQDECRGMQDEFSELREEFNVMHNQSIKQEQLQAICCIHQNQYWYQIYAFVPLTNNINIDNSYIYNPFGPLRNNYVM